MVGSRHPTGIIAHHAGIAYQNILYGIIEAVTHMQNARNIGRRYYNGIGGPIIGGASKIAFFIPVGVPLCFNFSRDIIFAEFHIKLGIAP